MTPVLRSGAAAFAAAALAACTSWGAVRPADDVRRATVSAAARDGDTVRISHYHGATVVRDVAVAPPGMAVHPGDRVWIDHNTAPPRILGPVCAP